MISIIEDLIPHGRRNRPGRANPCRFITIHNTGNTSKGAGARNHAAYIKSDAAANAPVSWHFTVDEFGAYQHLPTNEDAFHAGDGGGDGNRKSIGIEIAMNSDGDLLKATDNAALLTADLCRRLSIPVSNVVQHSHWSGKNCPQMIRAGKPYSWNMFTNKVENAMRDITDISVSKRIWEFLKSKGLSDHAVAGIMGNLFAESAFRANNLQNTFEKSLRMTDEQYTTAVDIGSYTNFVRDSAGYGLAQWTYHTRKQALLDFARAAGTSIGDLAMQLDFLWKELQTYSSVISKLRDVSSVLAASNIILFEYEQPADQSAAVQTRRAEYSQVYFDKYASNQSISFPDVASWAAEAWRWAAETGLVDGTRPTEAASRQEVVTLIHRMYRRLNGA